jgi:CreA protein
MRLNKAIALALVLFGGSCMATSAFSEEKDIECVSTTFRLTGNDKVCVSRFDDETLGGVSCYISQARTGGVKGTLGVAEDPSRFALSCNQTGPIAVDISKLKDREEVFSSKTSLIFKHTQVYRMVDADRKTLVYVAFSDRVIEGSPYNAVASVAVRPWSAP